MTPIVLALVGVCVIWLIWGNDIAKSDLINKCSAAIIIIIFFPIIFVWKFLTIPEKEVQIVIGTGRPYWTVEPSGLNRTRIVRVMLRNNTCNEISRGTLNILNLNPPNGQYKDFILKDHITIGPHGIIFIDVAAYNEGTSEALIGLWIQLVFPRPSAYLPLTFNRLPIRSHTFHLKFSSIDENILDEIYCRIFVDSDHVLHLEEWS